MPSTANFPRFMLFVAVFSLSLFFSCTSNTDEIPNSTTQSGIIPGPSINYGGEIYETVVINNLTWFNRNLNYDVESSKCYNNDTANCTTYGRLYDWATAVNVCPSGWHLPNNDEWVALIGYGYAGWKSKDKNGFSALPSGTGDPDGSFYNANYYGFWWSASEYYADSAYYWVIGDDAAWNVCNKNGLLSVRCVQDR